MSQTEGSGSGSMPKTNPDADPRAVARDEAWLHAIPGHKKGVVTCWHCIQIEIPPFTYIEV